MFEDEKQSCCIAACVFFFFTALYITVIDMQVCPVYPRLFEGGDGNLCHAASNELTLARYA